MSKPQSMCPICQCQIPKVVERELQVDQAHEDEKLPPQLKEMDSPATPSAIDHREQEDSHIKPEEFLPDPRNKIPTRIHWEDTVYLAGHMSFRVRLTRFLNSVTAHLRAGDAWQCRFCKCFNKDKLCKSCGSTMYPFQLNKKLRKEKACFRCNAMVTLVNSCPSCGRWIPIVFDVRRFGPIKWHLSPESDLPIDRDNPALNDIEEVETDITSSFEAELSAQQAESMESADQTRQAEPNILDSVSDFTDQPRWMSSNDEMEIDMTTSFEAALPAKVEADHPEFLQSGVKESPSTNQWASYTPAVRICERKSASTIAGKKAQAESRTSKEQGLAPFIRFTSGAVPLRRVIQDLPANENDNNEQPYSADDMDRMTRRPRHDSSGNRSRQDQQSHSGDETGQKSSNSQPLIRRVSTDRTFSPSELQALELKQSAHTDLEAGVPSRMDRRRETLMQGLDGAKQPDRRKGYRKPRSEDLIEYDDDDSQRQERKRAKKVKGAAPSSDVTEGPTPIYLPDFITVINLATALDINIGKFTGAMESLGFEDTSNDLVLDAETAGLIAAEFNFEAIVNTQEEMQDLKPREEASDKSELPVRPPVVTIMGHVDHGKTTILDYLRKSSVAASEHGGITQHIGAFSVSMPSGRLITFLDTPGHKAFLDMRQRGANVTDIVILVVAADDSVKPQTIEAIKHAKGADVQMIVAINKIDKGDADLDRVKGDLARNGVIIEEFGGDVQVIGVSGKTGEGMADLEEATIALADTLELRAPTDGTVEGWILEATTTKAGRVATILVRRGTLTTGQTIVAGTTWTKVRTLRNEASVEVPFAGPGTPVEVDGWRDQPAAGDEVLQANDESHARSVIDHRIEVSERKQMTEDVSAINEMRRLEQEKREREDAEDIPSRKPGTLAPDETRSSTGPKEVPLLVKADVSGSVEAILTSLPALGNTEVRPQRLRAGVGPVSESDVEHAATAKGHIIAFNTSTEAAVRRLAEQKGVSIIEQTIIYRLMEEINKKLSEYLKPLVTTKVIGEAEVAQIFEITIKGRKTSGVAGCKVRNGVINKNAKCKVLREGEVVYDGMSLSLVS